MPFAQRLTKIVFVVLVMVAMLWASAMATSHVDGMGNQNSVVATLGDACCPDQGDVSQDGKSVPHNCCMAHCISLKAPSPVLALVRIQPYATVIHTIADGDVAPNQFLKGLFRPPRTLA